MTGLQIGLLHGAFTRRGNARNLSRVFAGPSMQRVEKERLRGSGRFPWMQVATDRPSQSEVFTQRAALVLGTEKTTLLQKRNHTVGEVLQAARQNIRHQIETVSSAAFEPVFDIVSDLFRRADDDTMSAAARKRADQLPRRVSVGPRLCERGVEERVIAIAVAGQ